ncbi:protein of unknown function [Cupriavidus taiwanensis]|nr:protein of unknown function [Cupriavidus taiwanensis]
MQVIQATELARWLADASRARPVLLDVREGWEVQTCALPGITHIPMRDIRRAPPNSTKTPTSSASAITAPAACRWRPTWSARATARSTT